MKILWLFVMLPLVAFSSDFGGLEEKLSAVCSLTKSKKGIFKEVPYAKLIFRDNASELYLMTDLNAALIYEGADEAQRSIYTSMLEEKNGAHRTYSKPSIQEAIRRADSAIIHKVLNEVVDNPEKYRTENRSFTLEVEDRDYDDDYQEFDSIFLGYHRRDKASYICNFL